MNARARRARMVLRLRWRNQRIGLTIWEQDIFAETKLFRTLRAMFPSAPEWMVRKAVRMVEHQNKVKRLEKFYEQEHNGPDNVYYIADEVTYGE